MSYHQSAKMNGIQRRTLLRSPHCTYCGMLKGTSQIEVRSNSEKINPVVLVIIELYMLV